MQHLLIRNGEDRLDIHLLIVPVRYEIYLLGNAHGFPIRLPGVHGHHAHVDRVSPHPELVVDRVLHQVSHLLLPEIQTSVAQAEVLAVVLLGIREVSPPFHIVTLRFGEQERVLEIIQICSDGAFAHILEMRGDLLGIGEGADVGADEIYQSLQNLGMLDRMPLPDILQIGLREQVLQIVRLVLVG